MSPPGRPAFCGTTAIVGVGYSDISRESGRSVLSLAAEAGAAAIADSGLGAADVDGVLSFSLGGDSVPGQAVATTLALPQLSYAADLSLGGQAPCLLVAQAAMAVASGMAKVVLVFRALNGRSGQRVGRHRTEGPATQYRYPAGLSAWPQYQALWARRYLLEVGGGPEALGAVAVAQRRYAEANERAVVRRPLTMDAYLAAPYVAEPFRVPDCTTEVDGACAVVVTSLERARDLPHPPVVVAGAAYAAGHRSGLDIGDVLAWPDYSRNFTHLLADDLWRSAGLGPADMSLAQIYDCFTSTVLMGLEGLGLAERGQAGPFVASGETGRAGRLPTNTNGGLLCEGYLHGMNTLAEAAIQVRGEAGERQVARHESCVVTSGALVDGSALVLSAAP